MCQNPFIQIRPPLSHGAGAGPLPTYVQPFVGKAKRPTTFRKFQSQSFREYGVTLNSNEVTTHGLSEPARICRNATSLKINLKRKTVNCQDIQEQIKSSCENDSIENQHIENEAATETISKLKCAKQVV
jgi:hypothetical protein